MIILGLDGATFSLIDPWVEAGHLPTFERLLDEGVSGELESTIPEITIPAWPAFATGRNPESFDLYGFTHFNKETRTNDLSHDTYVPGKMWDVVSAEGGRVVVFNIPGSYPWAAVNGTIIGAAPEYKEAYAYPPERWEELATHVDGYKLRNDAPTGSQEYVEQSLSLLEKRFSGFEYLIEKENPDLAVGLIRATDRVAHHFWRTDADEENPLFQVYRAVDAELDTFLDRHPDENIIVMSDHGFEGISSRFAPNKVLREEGLASLTESGSASREILGYGREIASSLLARLGLLTVAREAIPEDWVAELPDTGALGLDNALSKNRIDWANTSILADVGQKTILLYAVTDDPTPTEPVVEEALDAIDRGAAGNIETRHVRIDGDGPHTPDAAIVIETPAVHATSRFDAPEIHYQEPGSGHAREGIFIGIGPDFQRGEVEHAHITDIAPTALHAMGMPIPTACDGQLLDVFAQQTDPADRDPTYVDFQAPGPVVGEGVAGDEEKEGEVKDRLRELGYLE